jgi:2-dehydro-3-deoxygluconokinase
MVIRNTESTEGCAATAEVVTVGEALLRLATPVGERLADSAALTVHVAGAEANVAAALAQLGVRSRWISRLPDDVLGRRVLRTIAGAGVLLDAVELAPAGRIGLFYAERGVGARPTTVSYDRAGTTFTELRAIPAAALAGARLLHLTGITAALGMTPLLEPLLAQAAADGLELSLDVNHRALLWSEPEARAGLAPLLRRADLVICAERDARSVLALDGEPEELPRALREQWAPRAHTVVVTRGAAGAVALDAHDRVHVQPAVETAVVDRFGMGDAFAAGLLWGLLRAPGDPVADHADAGRAARAADRADALPHALRAAVALAALKATVVGDLTCADADELRAALGSARQEIVR